LSKTVAKQLESNNGYSKSQDYYMLMKFRLSLMVVVSAVLAYLVATGFAFDWTTLALLFLGGFAVTAASNGIKE